MTAAYQRMHQSHAVTHNYTYPSLIVPCSADAAFWSV